MIRGDDVHTGVRVYLDQLHRTLDDLSLAPVQAIVERLYAAFVEGRKVLIIGNGGSASTASHMACDLSKSVFGPFSPTATPIGRFKVLALTESVALMTAWANDADYSRVFVEQVRTHLDAGDVLIAITGSGKSANVLEAVKLARSVGAETIGLLGFDGGDLLQMVDHAIVVPSDDYGVVETVHLALDHMLADALRRLIAAGHAPTGDTSR